MNIAEGSLEECRYYLILVETWATGILSDSPNVALMGELQRMLSTLRGKIEVRLATNHQPLTTERLL